LHDLQVLKVGEFRCKLVESVLEHFVHLRGTADPQFLAGLGKVIVQEALIPTFTLLVGES